MTRSVEQMVAEMNESMRAMEARITAATAPFEVRMAPVNAQLKAVGAHFDAEMQRIEREFYEGNPHLKGWLKPLSPSH
jgi:hypothetical protein